MLFVIFLYKPFYLIITGIKKLAFADRIIKKQREKSSTEKSKDFKF